MDSEQDSAKKIEEGNRISSLTNSGEARKGWIESFKPIAANRDDKFLVETYLQSMIKNRNGKQKHQTV